ncbi:putative tyrosine protein phosphatase SIW14 NDAI_0G00770 [Naumovozyma dairenensis CBS 421]|uniref:diphosphoinositol-polyphosphate diphosphatase n=1 Tax=Naumovozyma dairenensis (strain ATCC 10597 / BCRC 20456 / CBS 421 / NBRC 0211 / NRRL Y-12639) TaxID=1071378 RepID=G0WDJ2_NAUDC|nr:hypothetical protein NDAI_0G00770 [Naumovozyma dairenensis CBS 421]CCD25853.2 hypothetical protein NDAI_0G00770 [Naumovozyma dairenensis CBS 421]
MIHTNNNGSLNGDDDNNVINNDEGDIIVSRKNAHINNIRNKNNNERNCPSPCSSKIDELILNETDIIRMIKEEGPVLTDYGDGSDIHHIISDDRILEGEFNEVLKQFRKGSDILNLRDNETTIERGINDLEDEDEDDVYDSKEHHAKSKEILSYSTKHTVDTGNSVETEENEEVIPPENFSHVIGEIYRSSFPRIENFPFLKKRLKLKSIIVLIPEEYPQENFDFLEESNIKLFQVGMSGNKEPFVNIPSDLLTNALEIVLNPANQPILIHCNRGKHRTGCLVGCIRKLQNWSLTMIFDEYRRFAFPKARALDQQFIEMYDDKEIKRIANRNNWLPLQW